MTKRFLSGLVAGALAVLAGCSGGDGETSAGLSMLKGAFAPKKEAALPNAAQLTALIQKSLHATNQPIVAVALPKRKAIAIMPRIEVNGAYATHGTSARRSLTLKHGMVTATRGFGEDLMSSDVDAALALIRSRRAGTVQRVQRYLDGENQTVALETTCRVTPGGAVRYQSGELDRRAVKVQETCKAQSTRFTNSYQVDAATGRILQAQQWISPLNGMVLIQQLR
ncbi:YjbF family lipoprotein [Roseovarius sp. A21]|uniref:YjbF family lipoprotein n=1 Tax=Roseovarius bejariae TaxID=2576383 RepID=A0A844CL10_9RHOB|nr:YjbF family lipoprotein [Roseovarius bejariae]MRU15437.1 YjbF family lipoprotein [Roseovarius bejariae]